MEALFEAAERWNVRPEHVIRTHADPDHVAHEAELGLTVVTRSLDTGALHIEALPTPGHSADHLAFVVNGELCFSGDILFKDAVGGGRDVPAIKRSVMDVLMDLPHELRVLPGHTDETTIGREWEENPFVRYWRGLDDEVGDPCRVGGEEATVVVDSPDYDGKGKLLVRFADEREAIVGGSRVDRG
jgi:glyoxylase-like metal-dependent hydrolase (beta-lactamase superfamily II)